MRIASFLKSGWTSRFWYFQRMAVLVLALSGLVNAPVHSQDLRAGSQSRDLRDILAAGSLRVAIPNFDVPGFRVRLPSGDFEGPEIDIAKGIASAIGVNLVFVDGGNTFNSLAKTVADLEADIGINRMSASFDRAPFVRFSEPYVRLRHAMVYNRAALARLANGRNPEEAFRNFTGRLGAIHASSYVEFARRYFPAATIIEVQSWEAGIQALRDHRIDVLYRDEFEVRRVVERNPDMGVRFGTAVFTDRIDMKVVYVCNPCTNLLQAVNLYIELNEQYLAQAMSIEALLRNARR
jgi:ABC-type amino acid transport substrate-binding protein